MAVDLLPDAPDPASDTPQAFSQKAAAFVLAQKAMVSQINKNLALLGILAAGGAFAIPYTFVGGITDADPGTGNLRFNNATPGSATLLLLDLVGADGVDYTALLDTFDSSSSFVRGHIRLTKVADPTKFLLFSLAARTTATGYRKMAIALVAGSSANPFVAGDGLVLQFTRSGDLATGTLAPPTLRVREQLASGTDAPFSNGTSIRGLNTVANNTIPGASLSSSQITLPAGTYKVSGSAPALQTDSHRAFLVSAGTRLLVGTTALADAVSNTSFTMTRSYINGEITLAAQAVLTLQHWAKQNGSLGRAASLVNVVEVYAEITFEKIA